MKRRTILYMFRAVGATEFNADVRRYLGVDHARAQELRARIDSDGYLLGCVKPMILHALKTETYHSRHRSLKLRHHFDVRERDAELIRLLRSPQLRTPLEPMLQQPHVTFATFKSVLNSLPDEVESSGYVSKFVGRKMRFIFMHPANGLTHSDLVSEMIAKGLQSVLIRYPKIETREHALNIARRAIHNYGISFIQKYARQSRVTMVRDSEGLFVNVIIPQHGVTEREIHDALDHDKPSIEDSLTYKRVRELYAGKRLHAVQLLSGTFCERFSAWLRDNAPTRYHRDNDELFDYLMDREKFDDYMSLVSQFLQVRERSMYEFRDELAHLVA